MKTNLDAISEILFVDIFQVLIATLTYSSHNFFKVFVDICTEKTDSVFLSTLPWDPLVNRNKKTILTSLVGRMEIRGQNEQFWGQRNSTFM